MTQVAQVTILNRDNTPIINRGYVKNSPDETLLQFQMFNSLDIVIKKNINYKIE